MGAKMSAFLTNLLKSKELEIPSELGNTFFLDVSLGTIGYRTTLGRLAAKVGTCTYVRRNPYSIMYVCICTDFVLRA